MKGNEVTAEDIKRWKKRGFSPVSCRLCGEVEIFPEDYYKPKELQGYECANCKNKLRLTSTKERIEKYDT